MKNNILFAATLCSVFCASLYRQGWRCRNALAGVFAKQKLRSVLLAWMLIALTGCQAKTASQTSAANQTPAGQTAAGSQTLAVKPGRPSVPSENS